METIISYIFAAIMFLSIPAIFIGMIKPAWVTWWEKREKAKRKKVLLVYLVIFVICLVLTNMTAPADFRKKADPNYSKTSMYLNYQVIRLIV
jgi:hypothetical protein